MDPAPELRQREDFGSGRRFDVATWDGIEHWRDSMLLAQDKRGFGGGVLATGLAALQERGELRGDADPGRLAEEAMATIQGGYLLSTMNRNAQPTRRAFDAVWARIISYATRAGA